jgi:Mg/Co/Ni transporter MgtE
VVVASLGHGSFSMTEKHYARQSCVSNVKTARVQSMLTSQRSMDSSPADAMAKLLSTLGPEQRAQVMALLHQKEEIATPN